MDFENPETAKPEPKTPEEIRQEQEFRGAWVQDGVKPAKPEPIKCVSCGKVDESNPYRIWCPKGGGERSKSDVCIVEAT